MYEWIMLGIGLVLTVGTGFFVASEFALVNLDRQRPRSPPGPRREAPCAHHQGPQDHLDAPFRCTARHHADHAPHRLHLRAGHQQHAQRPAAVRRPAGSTGARRSGAVVGIFLATIFSMVIGELVPKNFALALPLATAKVVVPFQALFTTVFKPVILLFNNTANRIIRVVRHRAEGRAVRRPQRGGAQLPGAPLRARRRPRPRPCRPAAPDPAVLRALARRTS